MSNHDFFLFKLCPAGRTRWVACRIEFSIHRCKTYRPHMLRSRYTFSQMSDPMWHAMSPTIDEQNNFFTRFEICPLHAWWWINCRIKFCIQWCDHYWPDMLSGRETLSWMSDPVWYALSPTIDEKNIFLPVGNMSDALGVVDQAQNAILYVLMSK